MKFLILSFLLVSQIMAAPLKYSLRETEQSARQEEVAYNYKWISSNELDAIQRDFLNIKNDRKDRKILIASFNFYLPRKMDSFKGRYFENIKLLEELSGMNYKKGSTNFDHHIDFKPHPFKTITAQSKMKIYTSADQFKDIISIKDNNNQIVVHQKVTGFSDYFDRTDIFTQITEAGNGSHFTIYSIAILNADESHGATLEITKKAMIMKLKDQMKVTPEVFHRN